MFIRQIKTYLPGEIVEFLPVIFNAYLLSIFLKNQERYGIGSSRNKVEGLFRKNQKVG